MNLEERVERVEGAVVAIKDLLVSHDDRLEDYFRAMRESREDFEYKLNALIDAQLKNETSISDLKSASESQLGRIETLENK